MKLNKEFFLLLALVASKDLMAMDSDTEHFEAPMIEIAKGTNEDPELFTVTHADTMVFTKGKKGGFSELSIMVNKISKEKQKNREIILSVPEENSDYLQEIQTGLEAQFKKLSDGKKPPTSKAHVKPINIIKLSADSLVFTGFFFKTGKVFLIPHAEKTASKMKVVFNDRTEVEALPHERLAKSYAQRAKFPSFDTGSALTMQKHLPIQPATPTR